MSEADPRVLVREAVAAHAFQPASDRFYFLRHGSTIWNEARICQGQNCNGLSETGLKQADIAAGLLADEPIVRIASSDTRRVRQTIEPMSHRALPTVFDERLREKAFGSYETGPYSGDLWARTDRGVELIPDFVARVLEGTLAHTDVEDTLITAHGGVMFVIAAALGITIADWARGNALPMQFQREAGAWRADAILAEGRYGIHDETPPGVGEAGRVT